METIKVARKILRPVGVELVRCTPSGTNLAGHLHHLFKKYNIGRVLDVGARVGEYGTWLRRNGYRGEIVSFEPISDHFDQLASVAASDPQWRVQRCALGSAETELSINVTAKSHFSSFLDVSEAGQNDWGGSVDVLRTEVVPVTTLDAVCSRLDLNDCTATYLKMDTQGWDLKVLSGATKQLQTSVVALQSEISVRPIYRDMDTWQSSVEAITTHGFAVSGFFPVTLTQRMEAVEFDFVAVRRVLGG